MRIPSVAYVMPTHNRTDVLERTIEAMGRLPAHDAELVVVDNASTNRPRLPSKLANTIPVRILSRPTNEGAAARNEGAQTTDAEWIVMLDDDSNPTDLDFLESLAKAAPDVLALSADIRLPSHHQRESGGLPEVFIGCGVAIRKSAFLESGGYDRSFHYYAEEYDLAAKLLIMGGRVAFEPRFRIDHHKVNAGRNMDTILARLVRNSCWVEQRYAPEADRIAAIGRTRRRYRQIADKERAIRGFERGLADLRQTLSAQKRTPMNRDLYDRFTGMGHARRALSKEFARAGFHTAALVDCGKNSWVIQMAIEELDVRIVDEQIAEKVVIGTLSPGPMLDSLDRLVGDPRVIAPWSMTSGQHILQTAA